MASFVPSEGLEQDEAHQGVGVTAFWTVGWYRQRHLECRVKRQPHRKETTAHPSSGNTNSHDPFQAWRPWGTWLTSRSTEIRNDFQRAVQGLEKSPKTSGLILVALRATDLKLDLGFAGVGWGCVCINLTFFFFNLFYLFIFGCVGSSLWCTGFSLQWLLLLRSMGSKRAWA